MSKGESGDEWAMSVNAWSLHFTPQSTPEPPSQSWCPIQTVNHVKIKIVLKCKPKGYLKYDVLVLLKCKLKH
jgi:hypothetical protein